MSNKYSKLEACDPRECPSASIMVSHRIIESIYRKHLKSFLLTSSQFSMLMILTKMGDKSQSELSTILFLDKSSVNRNLKRLLDDKLIKKEGIHQITILNKGKQFLEDAIPAWDVALKECEERLGPEGIVALKLVRNNLKRTL
jgi:DNA-binding MarR family transcriptional regulator